MPYLQLSKIAKSRTAAPGRPEAREAQRLAALARYEILDTPPEPAFDRLTALAAAIYKAPMALVSLVDQDRQWFKSRVGLEVRETPRSVSFCQHAIEGDGVLIINDAASHPLVQASPLVTSDPFLRFYAGAPLKTPDGHRLGTLCILDRAPRLDFTAEDARTLEALAAIAVDALELRRANGRLKDAIQHAEASSDAKSSFLATMSHEIRTPMNGVIGMAELLAATALNAQQRHYVEMILTSGETLLHIINDILDFSKIEVGMLDLEQIDVDIHEVVTSVTELLLPRARAKRLALEALVSSGVPRGLRGDPGRIRQILLNLVGNAIKFTEEGEVRLVVRAGVPREDGRAALRFEVADTGVGIAPDALPRLFDRFVQADSSTSRRYGGTGLGLAISKQLVALMGGDISVESTLGRGTTFTFTLVLDPVAAAPRRAVAEAQGVRPLHVLLVEDHAVNQLLCRTILEQAGCTVDLAVNGREAVTRIEDGLFDLILMDVHMPEMDGIEATRRVRAMAGMRAELPIIGLTANVMPENIEACRTAGMNEVLGKPLRPAELFRVIRRVIEGEPAAAGEACPAPRLAQG